MLGKLVGLASLGGAVANVTMFQRYLSGSYRRHRLDGSQCVDGRFVDWAGGFYRLYQEFLVSNIDADTALATVGAMVLVLAVALATLARLRLRQLRELPRHVLAL